MGGPAVRLIDTDVERPQLTAAIDEVLLDSRIEEACPDTVHLYRRRPPSVSIGYFQTAEEVTDLELCRRDGVPVVRRVSGGGAINTDERQLVYALAHRPRGAMSAKEGFALACGALVRALERLGLEGARVSGVNDVVVGEAKVSGSAQAVRRGVHLVHGTVLVDADLGAMFTYLRPLNEKMRARGHQVPRTRVATLSELMGHRPPLMEEVKLVVAEELARAVKGVLEAGELAPGEDGRARELERTRYTQDGWNLMR